MICCLNEAKIILQCGDKSMNLLGDCAVEEPDRHCTLQASAFHLTDGKFHLHKNNICTKQEGKECSAKKMTSFPNIFCIVLISVPCLQAVDGFLVLGLWYGMAH